MKVTKVRIKDGCRWKFAQGEVLDVLGEQEEGHYYRLRPSFFDETSEPGWFPVSRFDVIEVEVSLEEWQRGVNVPAGAAVLVKEWRLSPKLYAEGTSADRLPPEDPSARRDREHVPQPATFPRTPFAHFPDLAGWTVSFFDADPDSSEFGVKHTGTLK